MTAYWGGHQWRVQIQWLEENDLWPTWYGVEHSSRWTTWAGVKAAEPTWKTLLDNAGLSGVEFLEDVTCDVAGFELNRGRQSAQEQPDASTLTLTLVDPDGLTYDPRWTPGGPSRTGARISVEVEPQGTTGWQFMFVGFVETWSKERNADGDHPVEVVAADALKLMARAGPATPPPSPVAPNELSGARIRRILDQMPWTAKWGALAIDPGTVGMNPTMHKNALLDEAHNVAISEDGMLDVTASGIVRFRAEGWRDARNPKIKALVDMTGVEPASIYPILCPSVVPLADDDLDVATRVTVSRSVEFDPDVPPGSGTRPVEQPVSKEAAWAVNRYGPIQPLPMTGLPHYAQARSGVLAQRWVDRLAKEPAVISAVTIPITKEPDDAKVITALDWGDPLWIVDRIQGSRTLTTYELIGIQHKVAADGGWEVTLLMDHWWGTKVFPLPTGPFSQAAFDRGFDTAAV